MAHSAKPSNESIISDILSCAPDKQLELDETAVTICRWRQLVGSYSLPALPCPTYVVHIGGKPAIKVWQGEGWSEASSKPSDVTLMPSGVPTRWLVDGELDVVTFSLPNLETQRSMENEQRIQFAFSDALGVALTRQIVGELYQPESPQRDSYIDAMMGALNAHLVRYCEPKPVSEIPTVQSSAYWLSTVLAEIRNVPGQDHTVESLAKIAGLTPWHFCRVFRKAMGVTPHQFVMNTRLNMAELMLVQSDMRISQISDALGFRNQGHFSTAFTRRSGETPSQYRLRNRAK
ncbi:helix-turn-helix transcriptional regulator [Massilia cavernae]|uniref:AraC family transcriptional regulator n=1 Tax=Massilia cavernae TaxID=2320864 RepID=A0A418XG48_9BURK|nr:helix-turn-helix transcriptional regulator [Massilia cavernae]RJG11432.1 AraC family transcriptional regulator [Massilia cavernae]